jgi:hypothetical protein
VEKAHRAGGEADPVSPGASDRAITRIRPKTMETKEEFEFKDHEGNLRYQYTLSSLVTGDRE